MTVRDRILARRARFVAASLAALGADACAPAPGVVATAGAPVSSAAATSAPVGPSIASAAPAASAPAPAAADADGDGIPDADDRCPTIAGVPSAEPARHGCPKVVVSVCLSIVVIEHPRFAVGSAALSPDATRYLDEAAKVAESHPEVDASESAGHCDAVEKPCPDAARAAAVRDALVKRGVDPSKLTTRAAGRDEPIASNDTAEGRAKNRRAELIVRKRTPPE